jgi:hypothetical protein
MGDMTDSPSYSSMLRPIQAAALVSTAIARPSELMSRMRCLLDGEQTRTRLSRRSRVGLVAAVSLAIGALGVARTADAKTPSGEANVAKQDKQDKPKQDKRLAARLVGVLDIDTLRHQAMKDLVKMGSGAIPALREGLTHKSEKIVDGAVTILLRTRAPSRKVIPLLRSVLLDTGKSAAVRLRCAKFLRPHIDKNDMVFAAFMAVVDEVTDADLMLLVINALSASERHKVEVAKRFTRRNEARTRDEKSFRLYVAENLRKLGDEKLARYGHRDLMNVRLRAAPILLEALHQTGGKVRDRVMQILTHPNPVNELVLTELLLLLNEKGTTPGEREKISLYLADCLVHGPAVRRVFKLLDATKSPGRREMVQALARAPIAMRRLVARSFGTTVSWIDEPAALWIIEALRDMYANPNERSDSLILAMNHRSPLVIAAAIRAQVRVAHDYEPARRKIKTFKTHVSPLVRVAYEEVLTAEAVRENFKFTGVVIADYSANKIFQVDVKGRVVFSIDEIFGVWDVESLASGNLLITEFSLNRVSEVTREGKVVWRFEKLKNPYDADRLKNGNTLISDTFGRRVIEVNKAGKIVWQYAKDIHPYDADRLHNGNTLISDTYDDRVIEVDKNGKIVWEVRNVPNVHDADRLPNGNTLLTIRMLNEVREVDKKGKTVWSLKSLNSPSDADRLPDGNTMVAQNGSVRIFNPAGIVLWTKKVTWAVEANLVPKRK